MRYFLKLTYDGTDFFGTQKQKDKKTVLGELEKVISKKFNENIKMIGCSRTDRGVHAINYYAHFDSDKKFDLNTLKYSINKMIDKSIYIKKIEEVNSVHSRYDVKCKEYVYKIYIGEYNPLYRNYYLEYNKKVNISLLKKIGKKLSGKHNFQAFTSDVVKEKCIRKINYIKVKRKKEFVYVYINASGFLKYMVRNIIGLMLEINEGKKDISIIEKLFKNKDRKENAKTAPPEGLYLNKIRYNVRKEKYNG